MTFLQTLLLGAATGMAILLGIPVARLKVLSRHTIALLNAFAIGVLFFLFVEVVEHAVEPLEDAFADQSSARFMLLLVFVVSSSAGLLSLVAYGRHMLKKGKAMTNLHLSLLIAVGIGLHNFSEGLAIGSASRLGELSLTALLFFGFGLHNITEAFGIATPLTGTKTSWKILLGLGIIAGGPTAFGTMIGFAWYSPVLSMAFLALAGGALLYVIGELLAAGRKLDSQSWSGLGLLLGFLAAVGTEVMITAVGDKL